MLRHVWYGNPSLENLGVGDEKQKRWTFLVHTGFSNLTEKVEHSKMT